MLMSIPIQPKLRCIYNKIIEGNSMAQLTFQNIYQSQNVFRNFNREKVGFGIAPICIDVNNAYYSKPRIHGHFTCNIS